MLAVPAEEKAPVIKIQLPKSLPDYGEPVVPQIEEVAPPEVLVPEPLDHYSVAQAKTEKPAPRRHVHVVRPRRNFFEKLVAGYQAPKTSAGEITANFIFYEAAGNVIETHERKGDFKEFLKNSGGHP